MITEHDLQEAIAECKGQRDPNANTCIKLAAFLILQKELYGEEKPIPVEYSYSQGEPGIVEYYSDTDFGNAVEGRKQEEIFPILDELMTTLRVIQPRVYDSVMRKIND